MLDTDFKFGKVQILAEQVAASTDKVHFLKSASNLNGNLNCSKELEHYAS